MIGLTRLILCGLVLWAGGPAVPQQKPPAPPAEKESPDPSEGGLDDAFEGLRALATTVPFDPGRYRRDADYRSVRRHDVATGEERLRRSALAFLAKHRLALGSGLGAYYRAMALRWSDDRADAVRSFRAFARAEREHPRRAEALMGWAETALELAEAADPLTERPRVRAVKSVLRRIQREQEAVEEGPLAERFAAIRERLSHIELRVAFNAARAEIVAERDRRFKAALVEGGWNEQRAGLFVDTLDDDEMEVVLQDDGARRAWAKVQPTLGSGARSTIGAFFRRHREELERDAGALIAARAMRLAHDPRASAYFERSLDVASAPRSLAEAALEWAIFALDELADPEVARRALGSAFAEDLDEARRARLDGVRARVQRIEEVAAKRESAVGRAWPGVVRVGGDPTPWPDRSARVWLFFAPWSGPSRRALVAVDDAISRLGAEVVGVTPTFGFGWRVQARVRRDPADGVDGLDGEPAEPPLAVDAEAKLLATFRDAGRIRMPLLLSDGATAVRFGIDRWPTAVVVAPDGRARALIRGAAVAEIERALEAVRTPIK